MRALILGSLVPQTARTVWRWLAAGHEISEIWIGHGTSPAWRRRDRRLAWLAPTWSLQAAARKFRVRVREVGPLARDSELVREGCQRTADVLLASCFRYRVPEEMLTFYAGRACNLHPALLPRYRGPAPMTAMLYDEDLSASGMTLHVMSAEFDAGAIIGQEPVAWPSDGWFRTWEADLAEAAGRLAAEVMPRYLFGTVGATPQSRHDSHVRKLPAEGLVLDERMDERRARWLAETLGRIMPLTVRTARGLTTVSQVLGSHAREKARPARIGLRRVECDVRDSRLALRRWGSLHRRVEECRELAALTRRPLAG